MNDTEANVASTMKVREHQELLQQPIRLDDPLFWNDLLLDVASMEQTPYKNPAYREQFILRDKALISFFILTGLRVNEALAIRMNQIVETKNFVKVLRVKTEKFNFVREEILMPQKGKLAPFTAIFEQWFQIVKTEGEKWKQGVYVFPRAVSGIKRHRFYNVDPDQRIEAFYWNKRLHIGRVEAMIRRCTGNKFPHWYRHVFETFYGRIICQRDPWSLAKTMGYRRIESTASYVKGATPSEEKRLLNLGKAH